MNRTKVTLGLMVGLLTVAGICNAVQVDGYCYLENQSMHDGTKVLFLAVSPYAQTDSTYTNNVGHYQINLAQGVYDVHLTHFAYFEHVFLNQSFYSATTLPTVTLSYMGGIPIAGDLSGTLIDTTYLVIGDIIVRPVDSLVIEPGAVLLFDGDYSLNVNGYLYAVGIGANWIYFQSNEGIHFWGSIIFNANSSNQSCISHCYIMGASASGVRVYQTEVTISHCFILNNSAEYGGGIYCSNANPVIINCIISGNNSSYHGGGIYCSHSNPTITGCTISDNNSGRDGGGIYGTNSNPSIINCTISGNSTSSSYSGGGISLSSTSNPHIEGCIVSYNHSFGYGGGIDIQSADTVEIIRCLIYNNTAHTNGGGIAARQSDLTITNCTIYGNVARSYGGGVWRLSPASLSIVNSIVWGDSSAQGPNEISGTGTALVRYCDVEGGWTGGPGNIDDDPLFINATNGDFHLESNSPCIDAGDPNSPLDPDGTRADMGAFFYDHYLPIITVSTNILNFGNVSVGEQTSRPLIIYNLGTAPLILYEISNAEPVFSTDYDPSDSLIQSGDSLQVMVYFAPEDTIQYEDFLSINNNHVPLDVRLVGMGIPPGGIRDKSSITIPKVYALSPAYPNPFNPLTTLSFALPHSSVVSISVFDITGRYVTTLLNGWQAAGINKVTFNGSELASGIYFCQMTSREFRSVVKMVLLK